MPRFIFPAPECVARKRRPRRNNAEDIERKRAAAAATGGTRTADRTNTLPKGRETSFEIRIQYPDGTAHNKISPPNASQSSLPSNQLWNVCFIPELTYVAQRQAGGTDAVRSIRRRMQMAVAVLPWLSVVAARVRCRRSKRQFNIKNQYFCFHLSNWF